MAGVRAASRRGERDAAISPAADPGRQIPAGLRGVSSRELLAIDCASRALPGPDGKCVSRVMRCYAARVRPLRGLLARMLSRGAAGWRVAWPGPWRSAKGRASVIRGGLVFQDRLCGLSVAHGGGGADAEDGREVERVGSAGEGFFQPTVTTHAVEGCALALEQPSDVVVGDRPGVLGCPPGDQDMGVGGLRPS